jgi:tRNA(fMet)-specific endonuclease VapC
MELHFGLHSLPAASPKRSLIVSFLAHVPVFEFDTMAAEKSAIVRHCLKSSGKPIGAYDPLIAGHALALGAVLVTANTKHFQHIKGLEVANWLKN